MSTTLPGMSDAQVRNIVQQELQRLSREALPASMRTKTQNTNEQRVVEKLNVTSRTRLTLDDKQPAPNTYLQCDPNGFAAYAAGPVGPTGPAGPTGPTGPAGAPNVLNTRMPGALLGAA